MESSTDSPVARGSSSAAAGGGPRGQRTVVDSASTSVRPGSVHARRHQSRRRRCRGTAGGDQRQRRRRSARCTLSTGLPRQLGDHRPASLHGDDGWLWTRTTSRVIAGSRKCSQLHVTRLLSARQRRPENTSRRLFSSTITFKLSTIRAVFVNSDS